MKAHTDSRTAPSNSGPALSAFYGKVLCEATWKWNRLDAPFEDCDLWYVWSGCGEVQLNGLRHEARSGDCFLFRPGDRVAAAHDPDQPLTVTFVHFEANAWARRRLAALPAKAAFAPTELHELYLERLVRTRLGGEYAHEREAQLLLELLLELYGRQAHTAEEAREETRRRQSERLMLDAAALIAQDPGHPFTAEELAARMQLSPRYFALKFKEVMGQPLGSYIIARRIERARYLLQLGMTVGETAEALGYSSIYFFSRQFKQVTGTPPSVLRS
ncbi:helix-turn-helix transcriptional regulator [Paenibacillus sp. IB182496]|uniref:Helix-turn-helix transcriptional regulator n=1 Tax=Paenibacillus sabuli TaxID=2772509 RepID=A0A927BWU0_9BACL|nr:AraC family transcriptional regulator [Paenibacillus sabuli]MBD2846909.1 helix-turn-helix transcriptional regulator [Paenibacillus sabuli]